MEVRTFRRAVDISPEKRLKSHLLTLSRSLPIYLVEKMTTKLFHTRTITGHEVGVILSQPTACEKTSQLIQIVLRKGRKASELFYQCLGECCPALYEKLTGAPATSSDPIYEPCIPSSTIDKQPIKDTSAMPGDYRNIPTHDCCATERKFTPYAPAFVINIHNSVLCHCVIGNNSSQIVSMEKDQCLHQGQHCGLQDTMRNNVAADQQGAVDASGGESQIQVQDTKMEYVIIGDHSSLVVNTTGGEEDDEEGEENEDYQDASDSST